MSNQSSHFCTCTVNGYSPDCPQVFIQNGKLLHTISNETRLKPRQYIKDENGNMSVKDVNLTDDVVNQNNLADAIDDEINKHIDYTLSNSMPSINPSKQTRLIDGYTLEEKNREMMRKYEALSISGRTLTDLSIGGFEIDLGKAAQKASGIVPLPPAKLPKIYIDHEMNFFHHFFQGLERLIGRDVVINITNQERYFNTSEMIILPMIEEILKSGFKPTDTQLTVFTKAVLESTFDNDLRRELDQNERGLLVAANLWGFPYIECGMEMRESDLRMWLSVSYSQFRNLFFSTFKDSGMPAFAMEGVQTRYETPKNKIYVKRNQFIEMQNALDQMSQVRSDDNESMSIKTRRSKRHSTKIVPKQTSKSRSIFNFN
jgi:hypothetical protein